AAATTGARQAADESLKRAELKAREYEEQLRQARNELYREQEEQRKVWQDEQAAQIAKARLDAEKRMESAKAEIASEADAARQDLRGSVQTLADEITRSVLIGRAR
ncbi:MAG TPA: hypothetical protein VE621_03070, partial [Bryobacteraceae bacterium]|nr:hypothetical protein [Bryobacteraceae bacterium]